MTHFQFYSLIPESFVLDDHLNFHVFVFYFRMETLFSFMIQNFYYLVLFVVFCLFKFHLNSNSFSLCVCRLGEGCSSQSIYVYIYYCPLLYTHLPACFLYISLFLYILFHFLFRLFENSTFVFHFDI